MDIKTMEQSHVIRGKTIANRIGFAPMGSSVYSESSFLTEESVAFYRAVAKGGTGLLVQGCAIVAPEARSHADQLGIWSDEHIEPLRRLTEAVHAEGKTVIAQLQHGGIRSDLPEPMAPSKITITVGGKEKNSREMTLDEIQTSQQQYLEAALRAVKAGYDGVEIHASHGWLISTFLSPVTNHRSDAYGEDKLRYLREVFQKIRRAVPEDFIVGVRISGYVPDLATGLEQARQLDDMGVDYISVSVNYKVSWLRQESAVPEGYPFDPMIYAAHEIKKCVQAPVFAAKGIRTGEIAASVLAHTGVDMVLVGRGHLCDTAWTKKALAGQSPNRCFECKGECKWRLGKQTCPAVALAAKNRQDAGSDGCGGETHVSIG